MNINDYDYVLPEELIAQTPLINRSNSKLMILNKETGVIEHQTFNNVCDYLYTGDVLVLNNTKVMPARILGIKKDTMANIELLLLNNLKDNLWECLAKPSKRLKVGTIINFKDNLLQAEIMEIKADGIVVANLIYEGILINILDKIGQMPLPPYIHQQLADKNRYQTVYAKILGSAAAPTAGFHFTPELLVKIEQKGIKIVYVTLHVGLGTFRPVNVENIKDHVMHEEYYEMTESTAKVLNEAKANGQRIIAVGTTSTRTLESIMQKFHTFKADQSTTDIFIYPGYQFLAIDALITNFHLPKSTLLMLVSALAGRENILTAYHKAIEKKYRFFSFGDAMFIKGDTK